MFLLCMTVIFYLYIKKNDGLSNSPPPKKRLNIRISFGILY